MDDSGLGSHDDPHHDDPHHDDPHHDDPQHEQIALWERRWLAFSGLISLMFVLLISYTLALEGGHIAQRSQRGTPEQILAQDLFENPGVRPLGPGRYQVTSVAQAFTFQPTDVRVPVGAETEFYLTSRDVLHGYQVENTNINVEVIPGEVAVFQYTFDEAGTYRVTCNEYCGIGHHTMLGTITVVPTSQWTGAQAGPAAQAAAGAGGVDGEAVYASNCASCHQANAQGIPGAFPPLAGHAAELVADRGREILPLILLYGLEGPVEVQGQTYSGAMPAWRQLSNEELAAVADHIVTLEGSGEGIEPYAPEAFEQARGQELTPADVHARRTE